MRKQMKINFLNHKIRQFRRNRKQIFSFCMALFIFFVSASGNCLFTQAASDTALPDAVPQDAPVPDTLAGPDGSISAITSIEPLPAQTAAQAYDDKPALADIQALFPKELSVFLDGAASPTLIPVTWECVDDYENTEFDSYDFSPVWDESLYPLSPTLNSFTDIPYITVTVQQALATVRLADSAKAKESLSRLLKNKNVYALVYLCDSYEVKQLPDKSAATSATVSSSQSVQIIGVEEDSLYNIWYQVRLNIGNSAYEGYIERAYLAYSDEGLLQWEEQNISSPMARTAASGIPEDIQKFPASYQTGLLNLKSQHPNWIFVRMDTDIDWQTAVQEENKSARSLISSKSNAAWQKAPYDNAWSYPTDGILAYYMDPRNFLTEKHIFQFEFLSYNASYHTESAVQALLNGTFMSGAIPQDAQGQTYTQAFCKIAQQLNVSPFHLASRVRQEQGDGTSPLISGTYPAYPGVYNYFNIGATGKGNTEVIENGLKKAANYGWVTRYLSLEGGSNIISKDYIQKGQSTLYLQKFNVNKRSLSGLYQHQYMQNIAAPSSEAVSVKKGYGEAGSLDNPFVFSIPVYNNMPSAPCAQPTALKEVTLNKTSLSLNADASAVLTASIDGKAADASSVSFSSSDAKVASVTADGTVTALSAGTAVISCTASGGTTASCTVTVLKIDPVYTIPVLQAVPYSPSQTLANLPLPAGWTWDNPTIIPTVGNSGYPATFTPSDTGKYNVIQANVVPVIQKAVPGYTIPAGLQTVAGNTLASLRLPAGFIWENPSTVLQEGTASYNASYNPDAANYETVTGISIPVIVTPKTTGCTSHSYGEWVVSAPATCTSQGAQTRSCHLCGTEERSDIPALGHHYASTVTKEPTETEEGVRTYICSQCNDTYTEAIAKLPSTHQHSYTSAVTSAATCTQAGILTYSCPCGDSYTETIPASGHSYASQITKEATETEAGVRTYLCSKCQDTYTEAIAKLPSSHKHSYSSVITKQASCTEKGLKTYSCSCGDNYSEEIAPLGHDMSDGKCRRCGYTQPQSNNTSNGSSGNSGGLTGNHSSGNNGGSAGSSSSANGSVSPGTASSSNNGSLAGTAPSGTNGTATGSASSGANSRPGSGQAPNKTTGDNRPAGQPGASSGNNSSPDSQDNAADSHNTISIEMNDTTVLYEETLSMIRGKDVDIVLSMGNSASWIINGNNIVADEANGIDMAVSLNTGNIPKELLEQAAALSSTGIVLEISLAHDGDFDFLPVLSINTASENAGRMAYLYYYNPDTAQLEFVSETEIAQNGDICFTFSHASDYAVIISETVLSDNSVISVSNAGNGQTDIAAAGASEETGSENSEQSSAGFSPSVILVVIVILLVLAAIAATAFFLLRGRSEEDGYTAAETEEDSYTAAESEEEDGYMVSEPEEDSDYSYDDDEFDGFE